MLKRMPDSMVQRCAQSIPPLRLLRAKSLRGTGWVPPRLTERRGPRAAPQRASRRAPRRPAPAGAHKGEGGRRAGSAALRPRADNGGARRSLPPPPPCERGRGSRRRRARAPQLPAPRRQASLSAGEQPQPPPRSQGSAALLPAVQRGQRRRREGPPVYATATGAAHRLRRAGQGWAGPGEAPPRRPVRRGSAGRGSRSGGLRWEL